MRQELTLPVGGISPFDDNWNGEHPEPRRVRIGVVRRVLGWKNVALTDVVRLEDESVRELGSAIREANSR